MLKHSNIQCTSLDHSESTLYQSDKAGLRNCINSLSKSSSHKYPKDTQWVIDGMATFRSVPPSATIRNCSKEL